jgi:type IV pilus assembly protein PilW
MNPCIVSSRFAAAPRRMRGFTLIELMIAMLLGLIVIGGVTSIFLANQQTYRTNEALSDVQEGARVSFEMLARDIRTAGLAGCNTASGRVANTVNNTSTNWFADWNNALRGYDDASTDPALSGITGVGAPVVGTSSVHILSSGNIDATVVSNPGNNPAEVHISQPSSDLATGDIIVICDYDHSAIVQITNYNGFFTVVHNSGTGNPGNCTKGMGYPTIPPNCNGNDPNGNAYTFPPNSQIAKLTAHVWYIGKNLSGIGSGLSLYRLAAINNGGTITSTPQEMVRNITSMKIQYLQPPSAGKFDIAANMTNWATVNSAQVTLVVKSAFQSAGTNAQALSRTFTTTATVRNRVL